jgi:hypothetical protein
MSALDDHGNAPAAIPAPHTDNDAASANRHVAGLHLVAEGVDGRGRRADPDQAGVDHRLREAGVLCEEAIAGVYGVGARPRRQVEDLVDGEVLVARRAPTKRERLIGHLDMQRVPIRLRIDRHACHSGVAAGPGDANSDLATISDQRFPHVRPVACHSQRAFPIDAHNASLGW